jgi:hypothetical protein
MKFYVAEKLSTVIPAQAGIHLDFDFSTMSRKSKWIPACAGMTSFPSCAAEFFHL